jgi:hypothetical protein
MNDKELFGNLNALSVQAIVRGSNLENIEPLHVDRWVAASVLQKGIRRGDQTSAKRAGLALLQKNPKTFWRRLLITCWEDIAFGDLEACFGVTEIVCGSVGLEDFDEEALALGLIGRLCAAPKNRIADDLVTIVENGQPERSEAIALGDKSTAKLRCLAYPEDRSLIKRNVAAWLLIGTTTIPSSFLPKRKGDLPAFFDGFCSEHLSQEMRHAAKLAIRKTRTLLPASVALLEGAWVAKGDASAMVSDDLLATGLVGEVPEYAFDGHTRAGCRYLRKLAKTHQGLWLWLHEHVSEELHLAMLKKLFFRSVSSQCDQRQAWGEIERYRQRADSVGYCLDSEIFCAGLAIFKDALAAFPVRELLA